MNECERMKLRIRVIFEKNHMRQNCSRAFLHKNALINSIFTINATINRFHEFFDIFPIKWIDKWVNISKYVTKFLKKSSKIFSISDSWICEDWCIVYDFGRNLPLSLAFNAIVVVVDVRNSSRSYPKCSVQMPLVSRSYWNRNAAFKCHSCLVVIEIGCMSLSHRWSKTDGCLPRWFKLLYKQSLDNIYYRWLPCDAPGVYRVDLIYFKNEAHIIWIIANFRMVCHPGPLFAENS